MREHVILASLRAFLCVLFFVFCCHCHAAQVVTCYDGLDGYCIATWDNGRVLTAMELPDSRPRVVLPPDGMAVERLAGGSGRALYAFAGGAVFALDMSRAPLELVRLGDFSSEVRDACTVGVGHIAAIVGGTAMDGAYGGADLELWNLRPMPHRVWNMGMHTLSGVSAGGAGVLVGVVKSAIFDPLVRLRPWLLALDGERLRARWKGTSFARPHVAAGIVGGEMRSSSSQWELWAIELTRDGLREVVCYELNGLVAEATRHSAPGRFGDSVVTARTPGKRYNTLYVWLGGEQGRLVGLVPASRGKDALQRLTIGRCSVLMARPIAWDVAVVSGMPMAVSVEVSGRVLVTPLTECKASDVADLDLHQL